jgi:hypothetical protein
MLLVTQSLNLLGWTRRLFVLWGWRNIRNFVTGTESQSAGDLSSDRTVMYSAYAGVPIVKSEVKEETDTNSDVKPAPLHCVDTGMFEM